MPLCVICEKEVGSWIADPRREEFSPLLRALGVVAGDSGRSFCPACGADDGERHSWLYLRESGVLDEASGRSAIHIGPEPRLRAKLAESTAHWSFAEWAEIDDDFAADRMGKFHLIVCNRILPCVADVDAALQSLGRLLATDGWLMAQCAYAPLLQRTLAFIEAPSEKAARLFFGNSQGQRLFGSDIIDHFRLNGLTGGPYSHADVLPQIDATNMGCDPREPYFLFSRRRCLTSRS